MQGGGGKGIVHPLYNLCQRNYGVASTWVFSDARIPPAMASPPTLKARLTLHPNIRIVDERRLCSKEALEAGLAAPAAV